MASPTKSGGGGEDAELPKALLKRILKARLAEWDAQQNGGDGSRDFQINKVRARALDEAGDGAAVGGGCRQCVARCCACLLGANPRKKRWTLLANMCLQDALLACSEAAKLFIHYLASTASDNCKDAKRQTISAGTFAQLLSGLCADRDAGVLQSACVVRCLWLLRLAGGPCEMNLYRNLLHWSVPDLQRLSLPGLQTMWPQRWRTLILGSWWRRCVQHWKVRRRLWVSMLEGSTCCGCFHLACNCSQLVPQEAAAALPTVHTWLRHSR